MSILNLHERLVGLMDHELAKALSHPLRVQLLEIFMRKTTSPSRISKKLEPDLSMVSYHVNVLKDAGLLEEVRVEQVRGANEHFYRASPAAYAQHIRRKELPKAVRPLATASTMQIVIDEGAAAVEKGTIDAHDSSKLDCIHAELDATGCEEVSTAIEAAADKVRVAQKRSAKRLAKERAAGAPATIILASFESAIKGGGGTNATQ
jgi:predicted transcriptional regulator